MSKYKNIIATLLIGLLGTALWEWIVSPFFVFLSEKAVPSLITLFNDSFYRKVAFGTPDSATYSMVMMIIILFILLPPNALNRMLHVDAPIWFTVVYTLVAFGIFMSNSFAHQTSKRTLRDIEIVAPYISDIEYKTLKSDFYRIDSKDDYISLTNQIEKLMDEYDLSE